jgi:hypothetical protein
VVLRPREVAVLGKSIKGAEMADGKGNAGAAGAGAVYGLGLVGALVYYISTANGFWDGVWGVIQALVWPAFFVYGVMDKLNVP